MSLFVWKLELGSIRTSDEKQIGLQLLLVKSVGRKSLRWKKIAKAKRLYTFK